MAHKFRLLKPEEVARRWTEIRALLAKAIAHGEGETEVDDVKDLVLQNRMCVMVLEDEGVVDLALAAEVTKYPRKNVLNIAFVGGKNGRVVARRHYLSLEQIGRMFGCSAVQCYCRPAVARYLKRLFPDVREAYLVMRRDIQ